MTRRRFYVPRDSIRDGMATLPPGQAHHLRDVLRIHAGDVVEIFDGAGSGYSGEVEMRGSDVLVRGLTSIQCPESPFHVTLAAALIKSAKFEWMLEKSTELGVDAIIPLRTRLSDIRIPADRMQSRLDRWNRILSESARQCKRFTAPQLRTPMDFPDLLVADDFSGYARILFYEKAAEPWQPGSLVSDRIILCVGPEGGWDPPEVAQAREAGYEIYGLGPWTLRAETAAIAALSVVQHHIHLLRSRQPEDGNP
jgi:16S rRNA (uracil1498-N3)-methyltransferase